MKICLEKSQIKNDEKPLTIHKEDDNLNKNTKSDKQKILHPSALMKYGYLIVMILIIAFIIQTTLAAKFPKTNFDIIPFIIAITIVYFFVSIKNRFSIFSCIICTAKFPVDNSEKNKNCIKIIKGCEHKVCVNCLKEFLKTPIKLDTCPINCPGEKNKCKFLIPSKLIFDNVDDTLKNKFFEFSFKKYIQHLGDNFFGCPTPGCSNRCEYNTSLNKFSCKFCNNNYCLKCKCIFHENKTCSEFKKLKINSEVDKFNELTKSEKQMKECTKCHRWVSKISGSSLLKCVCKNEFCYVCGELTSINHTICKFKFDANLTSGIDECLKKYNQSSQTIAEIEIVKRNLINNRIEYMSNLIDDMYSNCEKKINSKLNETLITNKNITNSFSLITTKTNNLINTHSAPSKKIVNHISPLALRTTTLSNADTITSIETNYTNYPKTTGHISSFNTLSNNIPKYAPPINTNFKTTTEYLNNNLINTIYLRPDVKLNKKEDYSISKTGINNNFSGPKKNDGTNDMRFSENRDYMRITQGSNMFGGLKNVDGSLDKRYKENKEPNYSQSFYSNTGFISSSNTGSYYIDSGPLKKDGSKDMRYSENRIQNNYQASNSNGFSGSTQISGPLKKDGTPDMRYSCNKRK